MDLSDIRQVVSDTYTSETIPSSRLDRLIARAVRYYSRFNPQVVSYSFSTVSEQAAYDLPDGCLGVRKCLYPVRENTWDFPDALAPDNMPSHQVIRDINESERLSRHSGHWEYRPATNELILDPEPLSVLDVEIEYIAAHTLSGTSYPTLPDDDLELIGGLVLAEILLSRGMEFALEPDSAEGLERETVHYIPENARKWAEAYRLAVRDKYGRTVGALMPQ